MRALDPHPPVARLSALDRAPTADHGSEAMGQPLHEPGRQADRAHLRLDGLDVVGDAMPGDAVRVAVDRIAFSWRARFPLAIRVFDGYSGGRGKLEARVLGVPVMRQSGPDIAAGEVLRYLAELPLVPWAMEHNADLEWRELDDRRVEVGGRAGGRRLAVTVEFDADGDIVRAGCDARPRQVGRTSVLTPWGGEFGDYRALGGMRIPTHASVYWELDQGRFVYWSGTVTSAVALAGP